MTGSDQPARQPPPDTLARTLTVGLAVALVGSLLVAIATEVLGPRIEANAERERQQKLEALIQSLPGIAELMSGAVEGAAAVDAVVVDLVSGAAVAGADPAAADMRAAVDDPARSTELAPEDDAAEIGRRPDRGVAIIVRRGGEVAMVVLPVFGQGFASTMWGYLALAGDLNTVAGLTFYEHKETPGLGGVIGDDDWQAAWAGKLVRDADGAFRLGVATGTLRADATPHQVDAMTGATYTAAGVTALLRFWLGDLGWGPYLDRLAAE